MPRTLFSLLVAGLLAPGLGAAPFTPGNLVVYRVGDGTTPLTGASAPVFLDEFTGAGLLVQTLALPTASSGTQFALTASGTGNAEGMLNLSADGHYLTLTGYAAAPATPEVVLTTASAVPRVVGIVDSTGTIDTSTAVTNAFSESSIRSAITIDGSDLWLAGGTSGLIYTSVGATTPALTITNTAANLRAVDIFAGQLYAVAQAGPFRVGTVGAGVPATGGQSVTSLPGFPVSGVYTQFMLFDLSPSVAGLDTLYISQETATGVEKFSLVGGTWTSNGVIGTQVVRGLTGQAADGSVSLFGAGSGALFSAVDATGYNATPTVTFSTLVTAQPNTFFRGIDYAPVPVPEPAALSAFAGGGAMLLSRRVRRR